MKFLALIAAVLATKSNSTLETTIPNAKVGDQLVDVDQTDYAVEMPAEDDLAATEADEEVEANMRGVQEIPGLGLHGFVYRGAGR